MVVHSLSVIQLEFSHSDNYLVSVSRDRHLVIFEIVDNTSFKLVKKIKGHERIIWSCSWSYNDQFIATGSRDKKVKIWNSLKDWKNEGFLTFSFAVTSVAFAPQNELTSSPESLIGPHLLAVGLETGQIFLCHISAQTKSWGILFQFPTSLNHVGTVKRMQWCLRKDPSTSSSSSSRTLYLATCSEDCSVKIFSLQLIKEVQ